jgi:selenocysteine lyase/cysteine desulfurase
LARELDSQSWLISARSSPACKLHIREFQIQKQSEGFVIRISIGEQRTREDIQKLVEEKILATLKKAGAIVRELSVEVVDIIERLGTGTMENLVT